MALPKQRKTETMSVSESRKQYSEILNRVFQEEEQVIVEKNGIPVAAIVPISTVRDAEITMQNRTEAIEAFRSIQEAFADIPEDELDRELAQALVDAKAIQRAKHVRSETQDSGR